MVFSASFDKAAVTVTVIVTILFCGITTMLLLFIQDDFPLLAWLMIIFLVGIYFYAFSYYPVKYSITRNELAVHRPFARLKINMTTIKSAVIIDRGNIRATRIFGSGGFFGYWGSFANYSIGKMTWYVTRRDKAVLVETVEGRKILLSPDEPEQFVQHVTNLS